MNYVPYVYIVVFAVVVVTPVLLTNLYQKWRG